MLTRFAMTDTASPRFLDRRTGPHIFTLIALASISAMATNIFLPSLPGMADYFGTTTSVMGLSVGVYLAASAVIQLFAGPLADNYGRRPVMLIALAIFTLSALGSMVVTTVTGFMILRAVQASAAVAMVLSRAIVRDMVPDNRAASMIAYVTMGMAIVPLVSPTFGGFLDSWYGWTASFWVLAGFGMALIVLCWFDQGETAPDRGGSFGDTLRDYPGLLRSHRFWGYCLAASLSSGAFFAYLGGAPFVGSDVFGLSPETLGMFFGAPAVGYMVGNFVSARAAMRVGINPMIITGLVITTSGSLLSLVLSYSGHGSAWSFFGCMTIVGLGNGLSMPNATAGMLSVRPNLAGSASGLGGAFTIGGGAALSAVAGLVLSPGTGEYPLLWIMMFSSGLGIPVMIYVIHRARQVGA